MILSGYANIFVFVICSILFVFIGLFVSHILAPRIKQLEKSTIYECGEKPIGSAWVNFNARFYIIALVFIIFDVEIALIYPVASVLLDWTKAGHGAFALFEIAIFLIILLFALIYIAIKKDFEWIRLK